MGNKNILFLLRIRPTHCPDLFFKIFLHQESDDDEEEEAMTTPASSEEESD